VLSTFVVCCTSCLLNLRAAAEALASMRRLEEYLLLDEQQPQPQSKKVEVNFVSGRPEIGLANHAEVCT